MVELKPFGPILSRENSFPFQLFVIFGSKTIQSYSEQLSELDKTVRRMILESLGLEKYMDEHMDSTNYLLRIMKYTEPETNETKVGLHAHTDKNIVTILHQNQVKGLEVLSKDGQWIEVNFSPDSFIVMAGDSLHVSISKNLGAFFPCMGCSLHIPSYEIRSCYKR